MTGSSSTDKRPSWLRNPYGRASSLGTRFRHRRFKLVLRLIDAILAEQPQCHIVDFGGTGSYWAGMAPLIGARPIRVTLVNLSDGTAAVPTPFPMTSITADVCDSTPERWQADLVHSNSLIEHVGGWERMQAFAAHARASAESYYIQTPNFWFPFELHFHTLGFHWLPVPIRCRMLMRRRRGFYPKAETVDAAMRMIEEVSLLEGRQLQALFPESRIAREYFGPFVKSIMAVWHKNPQTTQALLNGNPHGMPFRRKSG